MARSPRNRSRSDSDGGPVLAQLLALAEDKRSRRGGFGRRIFLESVE
jgi:hypothetical protein